VGAFTVESLYQSTRLSAMVEAIEIPKMREH